MQTVTNRPASPDIDFTKVASLGNELLETLDALRAVDPIVWSERHRGWIVTGHKEVAEGFRGDLPFTVVRMHNCYQSLPEDERAARIPFMMRSLPHWIINMDPPGQVRLRRLMMKAFSRKVAEDQRAYVRGLVTDVLDRAERSGTVEFVSEISREIPQLVILRLMGLPESYKDRMSRWVSVTTPTLSSYPARPDMLDRCEAVFRDMYESFSREIAARREKPTEDFISALVTARDEGDQLTDEELAGICFVTILAGHNTTANTIALGTAALAQHPEACEVLRSRPDTILDSVMEIMRYVAMSTAQVRVATADFDWHGHPIRAGQMVYLMIAAANRDPAVFRSPGVLDLTRPQDANMTFAPGLHFCIGHLLAKVQLTEFFAELVRRFDLELLDSRLDFGDAMTFRGLNSLHIRFRPRRGD